jgi:FAD/FMN-containing dehydrogenase
MAVTIRKAHHQLYYDLAGIVGPSYTSDDDFTLETYSRDTSPLPPNKQGIVVRPANIDEVVDIVKLANTTKIPIVPSGGRASFYGTPKGLHGKGIVVDMTRINRMINIDVPNLTATAEAGITTSEFTTRIWDAGWNVHTAIQPWFSDTLGGQLAGFCGGGDGLEMFSVGHNALHIAGLKVVLPDGTVVQTGAGAGNNIHNKMLYDRYAGGPDLTGIFIGSGGTFGIIVEATYRIYRNTLLKKPWGYVFESFDKGWDCVLELSEIEPLPYYAIAFIPPTKLTASLGMDQHLIMGGVKGNTENQLNANWEIVEKVLKKHKASLGTGPQVEDWKQALLTGRRHREMGEFASPGVFAFFEYYIARSQVKDCHHTTTKFIYDRLKKEGVEYVANEGIVPSQSASWIVSNILWTRGEDRRAQKIFGDTFAEATDLACSHGWYPDCHQGWGTRMMAKYWPKHHYEFMKKLKGALDPNNIMNPGIWDL